MTSVIIPAAGSGSRLGANRPKALVELGQTPLIDFVLRALPSEVQRVVVVVNPSQLNKFEKWRNSICRSLQIMFAIQPEPTGSFDAVCCGLKEIYKSHEDSVIVVWSDQVGVSTKTLFNVWNELQSARAKLVLPLIQTDSPYVSVDLDKDTGRVVRIQRVRDGHTPITNGFADLGVFGFTSDLGEHLLELNENGTQQNLFVNSERDFTYLLPQLSLLAKATVCPISSSQSELISVNSSSDYEHAKRFFNAR